MWIDRLTSEEIMEPLWDGHRERLRLRMQFLGADRLKFHEQIEIILCSVIPQVDLSDVSRRIADKFINFTNLINADPDELDDIEGVTPFMKEWLLSVGELIDSYSELIEQDCPEIMNFRDAMDYIPAFRHQVRPQESWVAYMNFDSEVIMHHRIAPTLSWAETEYMRDVLKNAIAMNARSLVIYLFVGNLPLEIGEYEEKNLVVTAHALRAAGIELLDLIYVGESGYLSVSRTPLMDLAREDTIKKMMHKFYLMEETDEEME